MSCAGGYLEIGDLLGDLLLKGEALSRLMGGSTTLLSGAGDDSSGLRGISFWIERIGEALF